MKRIAFLMLALASCDKPRPQATVTVDLPEARKARVVAPSPTTVPTKALTPQISSKKVAARAKRPAKLDNETGLCLGKWMPYYRDGIGDSFTLSLSREGWFDIDGRDGAWKPTGFGTIALQNGGRLGECGKRIAHLDMNGKSYSLRRAIYL